MKIEGNGIKTVIGSSPAEGRGPAARSGERPDSGPTSSTVQLSNLSARMREIESRLGETQIVDAGRVEEIKQAIAEGRFKVNPEAVADKLIDTVRELIGSHKA